MATPQVGPLNSQPQVFRPLANFPPNIWGDRFTSFSIDNKVWEMHAKQNDVLKEEVRSMLLASEGKTREMINLINTLERLGVAYHFEKEIEEQLEGIFYAHNNLEDNEEYDLCTVALIFRVLRQHGKKMSCDVFNKFKDSENKFKDSLTSDVMGMLSLYEASHVRTHGDDILDEALTFTTTHLESMLHSLSPLEAKHVMHALKQSLHKGIPRVEARHYITVYEEDPSKNDVLLKFSKIDFNLLQLLHKEELCQVTSWWKDLNFESRLPYARNRAVECYLWAVTVYFEPQYALARTMLAKTMLMFSITDDTYDAYGTFDELKLYTDAMQRWDLTAIDQLPDYMKIIYKALLDLYNEIDAELSKEGRSYGAVYSKEAFKEVVRCYDIETIWFHQKYVPPFNEYMRNALVTGSNFLHATSSFMAMGEVATIDVFEWAQKKPKILIASNTVGRLVDDIMSHEEEKERGHVATGIECYMKEHGLSKEEVIEVFYNKIENAWKDINEECLMPTSVPMPFLTRALNLTRILDVVYKYEDGYTHPEKVLKDHIISLFIEPITI